MEGGVAGVDIDAGRDLGVTGGVDGVERGKGYRDLW